MFHSAALFLLLAFIGANAEDMKAKLMPVYVNHGLHCMKELKAPLNTCKEMIQDGNDNTQAKYDQCKCVPACVAKRVQAMNEEGEADEKKITELVAEFQIPEWDTEWKRVHEICKPKVDGLKNCELGSTFVACGYKESAIFREILQKLLEKMS